MKDKNRINDNELMQVNGGVHGKEIFVREKTGHGKAAAEKKKNDLGYHWGGNWGDEGYWR